ncbi:hypothetical protein LINGRAHAP2_LOCUS30731 [Linum grandiflorum]
MFGRTVIRPSQINFLPSERLGWMQRYDLSFYYVVFFAFHLLLSILIRLISICKALEFRVTHSALLRHIWNQMCSLGLCML